MGKRVKSEKRDSFQEKIIPVTQDKSAVGWQTN